MAGASKNHNLILVNISRKIGNALENVKSPCKVFVESMKVRISAQNTSYFYPDVMVACDTSQDDSEYYTNSPIIIAEVLSESTRKTDFTTKKQAYFNIPTLQEYVIIEQKVCQITVFRKNTDCHHQLFIIRLRMKKWSISSKLNNNQNPIRGYKNYAPLDISLSKCACKQATCCCASSSALIAVHSGSR